MHNLNLSILDASAHEIISLRKAILRPSDPDTSWCSYAYDTDPRAVHLRAVVDGSSVGMITLVPDGKAFPDGYEAMWRIRGLGVREPFRQKQIASDLIRTSLQKIADDPSGRQIWLSGRTTQTNLYQRHGFERVGSEYNIAGTGPHYDFVLRGQSEHKRTS